MTYRGHVQNGQIALDEPASLPEGAQVKVEIVQQAAAISRPKRRGPLPEITPLQTPGGPLADELLRDRR